MSDALVYLVILLSALVILLGIWALISVFRSEASVGIKALWAIGISLFPIIGLLAWALFGPKPTRRGR